MIRRKLTAEFRTKVVLEALKEQNSAKELAQRSKLSPQQISTWKRKVWRMLCKDCPGIYGEPILIGSIVIP